MMKQVEYNRILVTLDGSHLASAALPSALSFAHGINKKVFLLRVITPVQQQILMVDPMGVAPIPTAGNTAVEVFKQEKRNAQEQLTRVKFALEGAGARWVETRVAEGLVEETIAEIAKEENIDIIVMTTHGRSGLKRILLGSVADYVLHHVRCPVLLIHPTKEYE